MKRLILIATVGAALGFAVGCNTSPGQTSGNVIGVHDVVFLDQLEDGRVASRGTFEDGGPNFIGIQKQFAYVTSADTNEVRALRLFTPNNPTGYQRNWLLAPNPLETLSIPTLDRPTTLATEVGINSLGQRVTGTHVFASHPGASELSIVSALQLRQLSGKPLPLPGPLSAMAALVNVTASDTLPSSTSLYFSTWDGEFGSLFKLELPVDDDAVVAAIESQTLQFSRVQLVKGAAINALYAVLPLSIRTLDGAPFCNAEMCLAVSIRKQGAVPGRAFLLEPSTGRQAALGYPGPVRDFASSEISSSLYGVLDEVACGGASCGGVIGVDLRFATTASGFPRAVDVLNRPFQPITNGGTLVTGIDIVRNWTVVTLSDVTDGGGVEYSSSTFAELGAVTTSDGYISFFSGVSGSVIDYDGRRAEISSAITRLPFTLEDGGKTLFGDDGGAIGQAVTATVSSPVLADGDGNPTIPWRVSTVNGLDGGVWVFDISDGYLADQEIVISNKGPVPGLVSVATSPAAGLKLATAGYEARAVVGDTVQLAKGDANDGGYTECGRTNVSAIGAGFIEISGIPEGCESRSLFSVYAGTEKSQVVTAGIEGYLGRGNPGDQITYSRPLLIVPPNVTSERTALTITLSPIPLPDEGAYMIFQVAGHVLPYRFTVNTSTSGYATECLSSVAAQVLLGKLVIGSFPINLSNGPRVSYLRSLFTAVPSGNALLEVYQNDALGPAAASPTNLIGTSSSSGRCWR